MEFMLWLVLHLLFVRVVKNKQEKQGKKRKKRTKLFFAPWLIYTKGPFPLLLCLHSQCFYLYKVCCKYLH